MSFNSKYILLIVILSNVYGFHCAPHINTFPSDFLFGAATSAYQIEGAWNISGKTPSIWDYATHRTPENIVDRSNGDIACDSYHKLDEDIASLKLLNVNFYRFSISWTRLLPQAHEGSINPDGVRYYNELIDKLIKNDIIPMVTLYHWDMHQGMQFLGGWANPLFIHDFSIFAKVAFELFGDRVKHWITINEPYSICGISYEDNKAAPFIHIPGKVAYICGQHLLLAHAEAYHIYKNQFFEKQKGKIGISIYSPWLMPATNSKKDIAATNRAMQMHFDWFAHPIFSKEGGYPEIMHERIDAISKSEGYINESRMPRFTEAQKRMVQNSADFLGLNYYTSNLISDADGQFPKSSSYFKDVGINFTFDPFWNNTARDFFKVHPEGLRHLLNYIKDKYHNPVVYITENGYASFQNETTEDDERIWYYKAHLNEVLKAINEDKCNIQGYTAWSLMDNFEWSDGYTMRFGSFYVDFNDPARTRVPKKSVFELSRIFKTHRLN